MFYFFPAAIIVLLAAIVIMPFTGVGSRALLGLLSAVSPLQIQYRDGAVFSQLQLESVEFVTDSFTLDIKDIRADITLSCLRRSTICLSRLAVAGLEVTWDGGLWRNSEIVARVSLNQFQMVVDGLKISDAYLEVETDDDDDAGSSGMPEVDLPFELLLTHAELRNATWNIAGTQHAHERITLEGRWKNTKLRLARADVSEPRAGNLELSGQLQFSGEWPFEFVALARWKESFRPAQLLELPTGFADAAMQSPWRLMASGNFQAQQFSLHGAVNGLGYDELQLAVNAKHRAGGELTFDVLELRDANSSSELSVTGGLAYGAASEVNFSLVSSGLDLPALNEQLKGRVLGSVQGYISIEDSSWSLSLDHVAIRGDVNNLPASVQGQLKLNSTLYFSNSNLQASVNGAQLQFTAGETDADKARLNLQVSDVGRWLVDSRGELGLTAVLDPGLERVHFTGLLANFRWQNTVIKQATLVGKSGLGALFPFQLTLATSTVSLGDVKLRGVQLELQGDKQKQSLKVHTAGDVQASLGLMGERSAQGWEGSLAPGSVNTPAGLWRLDSPVALNWASTSSHFKVAPHCWQSGSASICPGEFNVSEEEGKTSLVGSAKMSYARLIIASNCLKG